MLWSDPSGHSVVATCGSTGESNLEQGVVSDGKIRNLSLNLPGDTAVDYGPNDFVAW